MSENAKNPDETVVRIIMKYYLKVKIEEVF